MIYYHKHARANLRVGEMVAKFADRLVSDAGANADDFTLVGYSMGTVIPLLFKTKYTIVDAIFVQYLPLQKN